MKIKIHPQVDDNTCGPTSLQAVYSYFGYKIDLLKLIDEIEMVEGGGTLAVFLGIDALKRGFEATILSYNLMIFDPSWRKLSSENLILKLKEQYKHKTDKKLRLAMNASIRFLELGGKIAFDPLRPLLFKHFFDRKLPILTGLSATYLYQSKREYMVEEKSVYDDVRGEPTGHFVVLFGFSEKGKIRVADPFLQNPMAEDHFYEVNPDLLIDSILLGLITYDANLLIIDKKENS